MTIVTLHKKRVFKSCPVEKPAKEQTSSKAREEAGARALLLAQRLGSTVIRAEQSARVRSADRLLYCLQAGWR
jgi:hypothetical protein